MLDVFGRIDEQIDGKPGSGANRIVDERTARVSESFGAAAYFANVVVAGHRHESGCDFAYRRRIA